MPRRLGIAAVVSLLIALTGCAEVKARRKIQEGNNAYYDGDYAKAIREYDAALASQPQLALGWYNLGLSHLAPRGRRKRSTPRAPSTPSRSTWSCAPMT
jgi:tetratricopeptide (TPR) repeat protein